MEKDKPSGHRKLLVLSLFKDSDKWIRDILYCFNNMYYFNDKLDDNNKGKIKINLSFCDGESTDHTYEILNDYRTGNSTDIQLRKYDVRNDDIGDKKIGDKIDPFIRFKKLAKIRNHIIDMSIKEFPLNDDDIILFADSDIKFEKDIVYELIKDMDTSGADIIAPMVYIEGFGRFKNSYFYDTLAFRDKQGNRFDHFQPYIPELIDKIKKDVNITDRYENNIVHELSKDIDVSGIKPGINIISPIIYIENFGIFSNSCLHDMLTFRDRDKQDNKFEHFQPNVPEFINKIKDVKIDKLSELRRINREMNLNSLDSTSNIEIDADRCEMSKLIDVSMPIEIGSVGSFYLMKYKVVKNIKYTGEKDSEQVEFMKLANKEGYKIFVSPRLGVLHINLTKYGMKWH